jgi:hypothetical protein
MLVKPFTPAEAQASQSNRIPDVVITAVNQLLAEKYTNYVIRFTQPELEQKLSTLGVSKTAISLMYENHQFDFESAFRQFGWIVEYDRPGYNESYAPSYTFKRQPSIVEHLS